MRAEGVPQPEVGGQVVVAGRQIGVVVNGDRILPEPARGLHQDHDVVGLDCGDGDLAVRIAAAVDEQLARCRAPVPLHGLAQFAGQSGEPLAVLRRRYPDRPFGQLRVGEPVRVQPASLDQRVHQGITIAGGKAGNITDPIAIVPQRIQQRQHAGRRVQADGVADPAVLRRVGREHQCHPFIGGCDPSQRRVVDRQTRDPGAPFGVGHIGDQSLGVDLLERERHRDDAAVEFRYRHLGGHVAGAQAVVARRPRRP